MAKYPDGLDYRKPRRGGPNKTEQVQIEERRAKALRLSVRGKSLERIVAISQQEDWDPWAYANRQGVHEDITQALKASKAERQAAAGEWVENENLKLDAMEEAAWDVLESLHYVVSQGELVYVYPDEQPELKKQGWARKKLDPEVQAALADGKSKIEREPLTDNKPVLEALTVLLKIAERRAKLNGWDAPIKKQIEVSTSGGLDDRITRLADQLENLAGGGEGEARSGAGAQGGGQAVQNPG